MQVFSLWTMRARLDMSTYGKENFKKGTIISLNFLLFMFFIFVTKSETCASTFLVFDFGYIAVQVYQLPVGPGRIFFFF